MIESPFSEIIEIKNNNSVEDNYKTEVLHDFWICCVSREASILGRKEVLGGKAKFGIMGDGKEVPQVAMARAFKKGDWRSGYYRDQTLMFALGIATVEDFFSQLYADAENDPWSGGRQMNSHFASRSVNENGEWVDHRSTFNISSDISSTGGQMARAVGLALASKRYRQLSHLSNSTRFSDNGNEICFCTIGDASTSEGVFWEAINAAGVLKIPMMVSVWDDGYGISVPKEYQTTKGNISSVLEGFRINENGEGFEIYVEKCWNYPALCELYEMAAEKMRTSHIPAILHIEDCTQQLGHSTSGSHERYKTPERLAWEREQDCNKVMARWILESGFATEQEVENLEAKAKTYVKECKDRAWKAYNEPIKIERTALANIFKSVQTENPNDEIVIGLQKELEGLFNPHYSELVKIGRQLSFHLNKLQRKSADTLNSWLEKSRNIAHLRYHTHLYSSSKYSALNVPVIPAVYSEDSQVKNGFEILNHFFDLSLEKHQDLFAFGEDVGKIGGVNQGFMGMQDKYGEVRVSDTGIREWTIMGQAIGMAMRGLRPIAEIQYLDYLLYGLAPLSDDLATLRYRSNGMQQAPAIIRTRGHRLEGIWHSGSPIGLIINSLRGIYILTPRNFVQAAGMYNTMLHSDDPALIIECLNGYRLKEKMPDNIGEYTVPLGVPEVIKPGTDVTLVTYGSNIRVALDGIKLLESVGISVELIDVQTLLPFDLEHSIVESLKKTNRIVFMDEDLPGGATGFMMREVLEVQGGYQFLDSSPITLTSKAHRPPFGSDGDYFSKPNAEDIYEAIYKMMNEANPQQF